MRPYDKLANVHALQLSQRTTEQLCGKLIDIYDRSLRHHHESFVVPRDIQTLPNGVQKLLLASRSVWPCDARSGPNGADRPAS
jgi:hypothetical protein